MHSDTDPQSPDELVTLILQFPLLASIDRSHLDAHKEQLQRVDLATNEILFHEGDPVDGFYFLFDGLLEVSRADLDWDGIVDQKPLVLAQLGPTATIGEMQILTGGNRSGTVTAKQPSKLVKFPKTAFDALLAKDHHVVDELTKTIMPRLYRDQLIAVLPKLFGDLDTAMVMDLESKMSWLHLPRGHVLCYQGEPSDSLYLLVSGRLEVLVKGTVGESRTVGEVSQGELVGEMGVFTGEARSATLIASRDSELVRFSSAEFAEFTRKYPQLNQHLTRLLIQRLKRAYRGDKSSNLSTNILVAPADDGSPVDEFAQRLYQALSGTLPVSGGIQPCLLLSSREVDRQLNASGIAQAVESEPNDLRIRSWLSQQEQKYATILLQTDPTVTEWTKRCIRNADEILFVAEAEHAARGGGVANEIHHQEAIHQTRRRRSLVLIHKRDTVRPKNSLGWLSALNLTFAEKHTRTRHFQVRRDHLNDIHRVARFVSGREIGLVLSGGGARGFAHVGCIRAMRELNIPIDMIGGVSMGSLVSAAYAYDPENFDERIRLIKSQLKGVLFDITAPVVSIARGRRFDSRLKHWFGDVRIEDLWIPYFCVSSNLTEADIAVFDTEYLWWAVRASGTLPGLTSPMIRNGCLLFDGCLLDNLPMDVMRERMGKSQVIAVDVVPPHDLKVGFVKELQSPSGWWLLWKKLSGTRPKVELPNIVSIMQRAAELGSVYGRQRLIDEQLADLYLQPPVDAINIADFNKVDDSATIGYDFCKDKLAEWQERLRKRK